MNKGKNVKGKQLRKPISSNFAPKRLAINFDPPMIIIQYLVVDTGKLYHHKMRLDSILKKTNVTRQNVLNYIKTKHHLYFTTNKIKDQLLYKFIDKILSRKAITKQNQNIPPVTNSGKQKQQPPANKKSQDDFQYLNDEEQQQEYYDQDYEDYQQTYNQAQLKSVPQSQQQGNKNVQKNAFMSYQKQSQPQEQQAQGQAEWDLDLDQNDDFV